MLFRSLLRRRPDIRIAERDLADRRELAAGVLEDRPALVPEELRPGVVAVAGGQVAWPILAAGLVIGTAASRFMRWRPGSVVASFAAGDAFMPRQFMRRHWQKKPLLVRQAIAGFEPLLAPAELFALASREEVESRLVAQDDHEGAARLQGNAVEMAAACGPQALLLELGSGSSTKTRVLLDNLRAPAGYVPVDIAREFLRSAADELAAAYPGLPVLPVCADFTRPFTAPVLPARRTVVYFPGSTIGNFTADEATQLLGNIGRLMGEAGGLLIGVDLRKDSDVLERAYNDARGVTAAFNKNLLTRLNRELAADFDLAGFQHRAIWDPTPGRIEMHLVSTRDQTAHIDGQRLEFTAGEHIRTEYSHKYTLEQFAGMATTAGLVVRKVWTDRASLFSVQYLTRA